MSLCTLGSKKEMRVQIGQDITVACLTTPLDYVFIHTQPFFMFTVLKHIMSVVSNIPKIYNVSFLSVQFGGY